MAFRNQNPYSGGGLSNYQLILRAQNEKAKRSQKKRQELKEKGTSGLRKELISKDRNGNIYSRSNGGRSFRLRGSERTIKSPTRFKRQGVA